MQPEGNNSQNNNDPIQPQLNNSPPQTEITGRIVQPLSTEEDIRTAVTSAGNIINPGSSNSLSTPNVSVNPSAQIPDIATTPTPIAPPNPVQPITETASFQADLPPVSEDKPVAKKGKGLKVFIGVIVILAGLGAASYFLIPRLTNNQVALDNLTGSVLNNAAEVDLISETIANTTYLRPQQWVATKVGLTQVYGASEQAEGQSVAMVTISEVLETSRASDSPEDGYAELRKFSTILEISNLPKTHTKPIFSSCSSDIESKVEEDSKAVNNMTGLTLVTSTCTRDDGKYTVKARSAIGEDRRIRTITLAATASEWDKNKNAFQEMLDSIAVAGTEAKTGI